MSLLARAARSLDQSIISGVARRVASVSVRFAPRDRAFHRARRRHHRQERTCDATGVRGIRIRTYERSRSRDNLAKVSTESRAGDQVERVDLFAKLEALRDVT